MTRHLYTNDISVTYLIAVFILHLTMLTDCANLAVHSTSMTSALFSWNDLRMYESVLFRLARRVMTVELALGGTVLLAHLQDYCT